MKKKWKNEAKKGPRGAQQLSKNEYEKGCKRKWKNNEFSDPGRAASKHPGGSPNACNLHGEEDHPKEREQENKRTRHTKEPRLGPCGPERILGGFWGGLGDHFVCQRATEMASKFDQTISDFWIALGSALERQRAG